jgi:hypothetical protein
MRLMSLGWVLVFGCTQARPREVAITEEAPITGAATVDASTTRSSVVELFTSEGCSSCPSADVVVNALPARAVDRDLVVIAWHVDYWDSLGWPDPFAAGAYTARQRAYATALGQSSVYTPEIVKDGKESSRAELTNVAGWPTTAMGPMSLSFTNASPTRLNVKVSTANAPSGAVIVIVVTESGLVQSPSRGENAGRTLKHDHVARAMKVVRDTSGETTLDLPASLDRSRSELIAFVELPTTMEKLAAARVPLSR